MTDDRGTMAREGFSGCLLGLAVGDALGAPLEFMGRERIRQIHGRVTEMLGGGWLRLQPGEYTDDTEMMLCLARSIAEKGRFDPEDVVRRFVEWLAGGPTDIGITTRTTLAKIKDGMPWKEASRSTLEELGGKSAGNGALMRCAPIALLDLWDERALVQDTLTSCRLTHWHEAAGWAGVALNLAIAALLRGLPRADLLSYLLPRVDDPSIRHALSRAPELSAGAVRSSGYAADCLQAAFWAYLGTETFEEALVAVVNLGEDADTAGAVCGALAGAAYGLDAMPGRWRETLRGGDEITALAECICEIAGLHL